VALAEDLETRTLAFARELPYAMRSSMLNDLEAGNRLELDWLTGAVVRLGGPAGVPTPRSAEVLAALEPYKEGERPALGPRP
jgi:2-dehydropantoate 2-reductase